MAGTLIGNVAFVKGCAAIGAGLAVGLAGIGAGAGESGVGGRFSYIVHTDVYFQLNS